MLLSNLIIIYNDKKSRWKSQQIPFRVFWFRTSLRTSLSSSSSTWESWGIWLPHAESRQNVWIYVRMMAKREGVETISFCISRQTSMCCKDFSQKQACLWNLQVSNIVTTARTDIQKLLLLDTMRPKMAFVIFCVSLMHPFPVFYTLKIPLWDFFLRSCSGSTRHWQLRHSQRCSSGLISWPPKRMTF